MLTQHGAAQTLSQTSLYKWHYMYALHQDLVQIYILAEGLASHYLLVRCAHDFLTDQTQKLSTHMQRGPLTIHKDNAPKPITKSKHA